MKISGNYGTHLAPLIAVMDNTQGDVLELGVGLFSTPYLHYQCLLTKRRLVSLDNDVHWLRKFASSDISSFHYQSPTHEFHYVADWDQADIDQFWDVVLVDHSPDYRRVAEVKRLADNARYIIIHDSNAKLEATYHYSTIYPLFKYRRVWSKDERQTTVLSNFISLDNLWHE